MLLKVVAVWHVLVSMALVGLILMHSGRETGLGGMGFTPQSQGGTHIVERNLTRLTIVVGHAHDGREAVDRAVKLKPDVVLMDIDMPLMDGFEATRRILERRAGTSILMLTGSNSREDVDRARQAGAAGYVTKDRIASQLVEAIVEAAGR